MAKGKSTHKKQNAKDKKQFQEKKSGKGKGFDGKNAVVGINSSFKPHGRFKKQLSIIGDCLFEMGFEYVISKTGAKGGGHHKFKHNECRFCQTSISSSPGSKNSIKEIVSTIKRMCLTQCEPPIPLDKIPAKLFTIKKVGLIKDEKEVTLLDVLEEVTKTVTLSAQVRRESREELRRMADRKGIPLGDLIEEMMEVYEKTQ